MKTIEAVLERQADGTLHLPLPAELSGGPFKVTATVEILPEPESNPDVSRPAQDLRGFGSLKGKIWMAPDFDAPLDDFKDDME